MKTKSILLALATLLLAGSTKETRGGALQLRGGGDYVSVPPVFNLANASFTVEFWARRSATGGQFDPVFVAGSAGVLNGHLHIAFRPNNTFTFAFFSNDVDTPATYTDDQWHHYACAYNAPDRSRKIYVDGDLVVSNTALANFQGNNLSMSIGGDPVTTFGYFRGNIDDFRIWNSARTQTEIQQNRNHKLIGNEAGLTIYFPFDTLAPNDATPAHIPGGMVNAPVIALDMEGTPTPGATPALATGVTGNAATLNALVTTNGAPATNSFQYGPGLTALSFDGVSDEVVVNHSAALNPFPMTVSTWVKVGATAQDNAGLVNKYVSSSFDGWQIFLISGQVRAWYIRNPNNHVFESGAGLNGGNIDDGQWHYITFTVDTNGASLYVDSALKMSRPWIGPPGPCTTLTPLRFANYAGRYANAQLDEVSVWNAALSQSAISNLMTSQITSFHPNYTNLVANWKLDEGAGRIAYDSSTNGFHGSFLGNPVWAPGARPNLISVTAPQAVAGTNRFISLDGQNDHVAVPAGVWFNNDFTVEGWVYARSYNNWSRLFDFGNNGYLNEIYLALSAGAGGYPTMGIFNTGNTPLISSTQQLPLNQWVHLAATLNGRVGTIYINGVAVGTGPLDPPASYVRTNNWIGRSLFAGDAYANADFDDVRIWSSALPNDVLRQWMNRAVDATHPNYATLQGNWRFDEASGTVANDSSPFLRNAALVNGALRVPSVPASTAVSNLTAGTVYHFRPLEQSTNGTFIGATERFVTPNPGSGNALLFDGVNDLARTVQFISNPTVPINSEITVEFWQYANRPKDQSAFSLEPSVETSRIQAHTPWSDGTVVFDFGSYASNGRVSYRPSVSLWGSWQHFAFVAKTGANGYMRIYRNGVLEASKDGASFVAPGNYNLLLGGFPSLYNFDGQLDEFRIWNVVRTDTQIAQSYNASLVGNESGLVLYYRMDETGGNALIDSSPRQANGYLVNGTSRIASTAPIGVPVATTLPANPVAEGFATLRGNIKGDGATASSYWFEYGETLAPVPNSSENIVRYFYPGYNLFGNTTEVNFNLTPVLVVPFKDINIPSTFDAFWPGGPGDEFGAQYLGRIYAPDTGSYTFYLNSDDGSLLFIDGALVVSDEGAHGMLEIPGNVFLTRGYHQFEIRFVEQGLGGGLIFSWAPPGRAKEIIPAAAFQRWEPAYSSRTPVVGLGLNPGVDTVSATISNLNAFASVNYRLVAANGNGTNLGAAQSFIMPHPGPQLAGNFDGVNDYFVANANAQNGLKITGTNLTVEAWIYPSGAGTLNLTGNIVAKEGEYVFSRFPEGVLAFALATSSPGWQWIKSPIIAPLNQWMHIAWVYDGANMRLYTNGMSAFSSPVTGPIGDVTPTANEFRIGGRQNYNEFFEGRIDEVRVWGISRTEAEIKAAYTRTLLGNENGLLAYYRFDERNGSTVIDSGPNGFNGSLAGDATLQISGAGIIQPIVRTLTATPVLATTATVRGSINPNGPLGVAYFDYGTSPAFGSVTPPQNFAAGISTIPYSAGLTNLDPGTTYYFRLVAYNPTTGTNFGLVQSFTTLVLGSGWPIASKLTGGQSGAPRHITDPEGNIYLSGQFSGSATFKSTLVPIPVGGSGTNAFVGKIARGADWLSNAQIGSDAAGSALVRGLAVNSAGELYLAGQFSGVATFGTNTLTSAGGTDAFVAKLAQNGTNWLWARRFGSGGADAASAITLGTNGGIYVAGQFTTNIDFGNGPRASAGASDVFVAKFAPDGSALWSVTAGGAGADSATSIITDNNDFVYLVGQFTSTAQFLTTPTLTTLTAASGSQDIFTARLNSNGLWVRARRAGSSFTDSISSIAIDAAGQLYITGQFGGAADYDSILNNLNSAGGTNFFVAKLNQELSVLWYSQGGAGAPEGIAIDSKRGLAYVSGDFSFINQIGSETLFSSGNGDVFVAQMDIGNGAWNWARKIGATGNETRGPISVDASGSVVVSGTFQNSIQVGFVVLTSPNPQDIFVARLDDLPRFEHNIWPIGQKVPVPLEAQNPTRTDGGAFGQPVIAILEKDFSDSDSGNSFVWSEAEHALYPVRPVTAVLRWPLTTDATNTTRVAIAVGRTPWPAQPQIHVANTPVELEPATPNFPYRFLSVAFETGTAADVDVTSKHFTATNSGYSVIQFLKTDGAQANPTIHPSKFEVVRTVFWNDPAYLDDSVPAEIGSALQRPGHNDPTGRNGFVYYERAFIDASGSDRAYDRETRTGPIIPVNRDTASPTDDLVVIWYHTNNVTGIAWSDDPVRYVASWPAQPNQLVIASRLGSGPLDPVDFPNKQIYNQPDPTLPGYNPNEEHAALYGDTAYALRNDLNDIITPKASEPYTLVKYRNPASGDWAMIVYQVIATNATYRFEYPMLAGQEIIPLAPISLLPLAGQTNTWIAGPAHKDYVGRLYARAAGAGNSATNIVTRFWYPLQPGFFYDLNRDGLQDVPIGTVLPLLDHRVGGSVGTPVNVTYDVSWPDAKTLEIGETLINAKFGLPAIRNFASSKLIYDQANPLDTNALNSLVRIFDPLSSRTLQLRKTAATDFITDKGYGVFRIDNIESLLIGIATAVDPASGLLVFSDLPFVIRSRLRYDQLNKNLIFNGVLDESALYGGPDDPLVLINVLSERERDRIKALDGNGAPTDFDRIIDALFDLTRNPNGLDLNHDNLPDKTLLIGLQNELVTNRVGKNISIVTNIVHEKLGDLPKAMTAGGGSGSGYVSIIENDDASLNNLPVTIHIIRIDSGPFRGDLKVIYPDNVFDEKLTFRHSADFGGEPQKLEFEWYYIPDYPGFDPTDLPTVNDDGTIRDIRGWLRYTAVPVGINGANDITIGDGSLSSLLTLSDNWVICRYRGYAINGSTNWSEWVGSPGGGRAQLAEGWIKRVINGLNPFEARSKDFHLAASATYASMLQEAGGRFEGPIAFNPSADNLNSIGLISAYETVLQRGRNLSIDAGVNYSPANNALLLAAGRIADFYMLLGNEAYSDAADPTIGFRTDGTGYGSLAPSIFTFQNQLDSLLEEELALLRGRDDRSAPVQAPPVYNRLFWNFTKSDGEVAYAQTYNITDQNGDGLINAEDARIMYPQGHGDAWGHYLTALTKYYDLLRNSNFTWVARSENILLAGVPVEVDYLDERKFAIAAAAKAKAGSEIVDLTYRINYVDDPTGQYKGYKDTDTDRAWGLSEWARRAGQGAYFDWVAANSILPAKDPNTNHVGIQKIDRTTVSELAEVPSSYQTVQDQLDKADMGLNPLGIAKNAVPFDIDPVQISAGKTHFEQIYDRAIGAMNNAVSVFNHANQLSTALRSLQDSVNSFSQNVDDQERDYKNRLVEIFGYPYAGDIGPGRTFPSGYDGPDLYHYMYVNKVDLNGDDTPITSQMTGYFSRFEDLEGRAGHFFSDDVQEQDNPALSVLEILPVNYPLTLNGYGFAAPPEWGQRRAPGTLQQNLSEVLQSQARLKQALLNYDNLIKKIDDGLDLIEARGELFDETAELRHEDLAIVASLRATSRAAKFVKEKMKTIVESIDQTVEAVVEGIPKVVGFASDAFSGARAALLGGRLVNISTLKGAELAASIVEEVSNASIETTTQLTALQITSLTNSFVIDQALKEVEQMIRQEAPARTEIFALGEKVNQNIGAYLATLAKGLSLLDERVAFRKRTAAETQANRYQDMTFRVFRNDAIQKYRAQYDLASRYVYLAATAYDFETQLLGGASGSGREFLTDIIRQRSLGEMENGVPIAGRHGLADPLARLSQNFSVLKGQMGFNNPQTETGRFSVRRELLRIDDSNQAAWRGELKKRIVPDLWQIPEFRRYCRPFAPESAGPQPGLVFRFPTTVTFGLNYFGWPLGGGDNAYDPTLFATKVRSAGVWFENYLSSGLSVTPRIYLVPVGSDIMRSPSGSDLAIREWRVVDQKLPVPFPIGFSALNSPAWIPQNDTLSDTFGDIRRFSSFRAYHDSGGFTSSEMVSDSRLIGRSVWNTDWMLIIPGGTFLFDSNQGLNTFVNSVTDIKIFFQTYSYSGN